MNKQISDQALTSYVDKLPKEMQPERDLWSGIERAIQNKSQQNDGDTEKNKVVPMAWAASVIAAILVAWVSFAPTTSNQTTQLTAETNKVKPSSEMLVTAMQESFQEQKQAMLVSYGTPDMTNLPTKMQNQLIELAKARQAIEKALANDVNNVDLLNLLRFTQQQELNLLQKLYPYMNTKNAKWQTI